LTKLNLQAEQLEKIRCLAKLGRDQSYQFLGYSLNLETKEIHDLLERNSAPSEWDIQILTILLVHYSLAKVPKSGKLVKFRDLKGGSAYERAFIQRAANPIAQVFGDKPAELAEAARLLNGTSLNYGQISVEIPALEGIPIVYILWVAEEFSASATILFDESASCFLPTEDLSVLGELTTHRLLKAQSILKEKTVK